jgi:hypothetical protein
MKILLNIAFEKLHRFVFDYWHQSQNEDFGLPTRYQTANYHNKLEPYNERISNFYELLCPYFKGWMESLVNRFPNKKKYTRYK